MLPTKEGKRKLPQLQGQSSQPPLLISLETPLGHQTHTGKKSPFLLWYILGKENSAAFMTHRTKTKTKYYAIFQFDIKALVFPQFHRFKKYLNAY